MQTSPIKHPNKNWRFEDARKAILVEMEAVGQLRKPHVLLLRFPDPHLSKEVVQGFSASIENVIFHRPATPRSVRCNASCTGSNCAALCANDAIVGVLQNVKSLPGLKSYSRLDSLSDPFPFYIQCLCVAPLLTVFFVHIFLCAALCAHFRPLKVLCGAFETGSGRGQRHEANFTDPVRCWQNHGRTEDTQCRSEARGE